MRARTMGKIITGFLTILFLSLCVVYAFKAKSWPEDLKHIVRAFCFGLMSVSAVTSYRYFED